MEIRDKLENVSEEQKELYLAALFNKCMELMDAYYRRTQTVQSA